MNQIIVFCAEYFIYLSIFIVGVYALFAIHTKYRVWQSLCTVVFAMTAWVIAHLLKAIVMHPRPEVSQLIVPDSLYSFPSGHATFMFALAYGMYHIEKRLSFILFILAIVSGGARVLGGIHFWYDIVGGLVLGVIVAYVGIIVSRRVLK